VVCGSSLLREGLRGHWGMLARFTNLVKYVYKLQIVLDKHSKAGQCGSGSRVLPALPTESDTQNHSLGQEIRETLRLLRKVATFHKIAFAA
jgi:hypothetical protein